MDARLGIIGCGEISAQYLGHAKIFPGLEIAACADINMDAARARAEEYGTTAMTVEELLARTDLDAVINLTIPKAHVPVGEAILASGKHVYSEKPLGVDREDARKLLKSAEKKGLRVGCAPDTFFGGGHQTSRKLVDDGWIGRPVAGTAFMLSIGPEKRHHSPFFFFEKGGGPLFDLGPYYIAALVNILGPVASVTARTAAAYKERIARAKEVFGQKIPVKTFTHATGVLEFASGALITVLFSWDVCTKQTYPYIEIFGTEATLQESNPNTFGGPIRIKKPGSDWQDMPLTHCYAENSRFIGVADMLSAIQSGRPHRSSAELAYHVLDVMCAFEESSNAGKTIQIQSTCERPAALPLGLVEGEID